MSYPLPSKEDVGLDRPIRFVYTDENGKFKIDPEAIDALLQMKGPIGVVSVCGCARQDKSFILNQLLGRRDGFHVSSTHRPCNQGLWMWTAPSMKSTPDGTRYNLILLESEGDDAYDQQGIYNTQYFSLAILLSSMFIYNQMGGIDEDALNRLYLVSEMIKLIHVRAFGGGDTYFETRQLSPIFVWLLRDFNLDSVDNNAKLTAGDYLELALSPILGEKESIASKNKIRASIQALFPNRECFALVRPVNEESDMQYLDQISLEKLQPAFQSGLDVFKKFVFERTKPKQVRDTTMTGLVLLCVTECYLNALNNGAALKIAPPLQDFSTSAVFDANLRCCNAVEDMGKKLREACQVPELKIDDIVMVLNNLLAEYEASVHGPSKWQKLASFLQISLQDIFVCHAKKELDRVLSEKRDLIFKCQMTEDKIETLQKQLESSEKFKAEYQKHYEAAISDMRKLSHQYTCRINNLDSQCSSLKERCSSLMEELDSAKQEPLEWKRKYDELLARKSEDDIRAKTETSLLKSRNSAAEAEVAATEWKKKYEDLLAKKNEDDIQTNAELSLLNSKISSAEARIAAAHEQARCNQKEANVWKVKYEDAVAEARDALEKAAIIQESSDKQAKVKEDALTTKFCSILEKKEVEIKDKLAKLACAEQQLTAVSLELKSAESKIESFHSEISDLKLHIAELEEKYRFARLGIESLEKEGQILRAERSQSEGKYLSELKRVEEMQKRCNDAEEEVKVVRELVDIESSDLKLHVVELDEKYKCASSALEVLKKETEILREEKRKLEQNYRSRLEEMQKRCNDAEKEVMEINQLVGLVRLETEAARSQIVEVQLLADGRHIVIQRAQSYIERLEEQLVNMTGALETCIRAKQDIMSSIESFNGRLKAREEHIGKLEAKFDRIETALKIMESRLDSYCTAQADASNTNTKHKTSSLKTEPINGGTVLHQDPFVTPNPEHTTRSRGKHPRADEVPTAGSNIVQVLDLDKDSQTKTKKAKRAMGPHKCTTIQDQDAVDETNDGGSQNRSSSSGNYTKFTMAKLREELVQHGCMNTQELKGLKKKDLLEYYRLHVLHE